MKPNEKTAIVVGGARTALAVTTARALASQGAQAKTGLPRYPGDEPPTPHAEGAGGRAARQRAKTLAKKAKRKGGS